MFKFWSRLVKDSSLSLLSLVFTALLVIGGGYLYVLLNLPDVRQLKDISMQVPLRIYTRDGKLVSEFGEKKRIPVALTQIPKPLINAILDTEDQRFFEHRGVDFWGLLRAGVAFVSSGRRSQGASTVTMQVARNFFLNREKTFTRKLNEILLAFRIDKNFSKEEILELYLNKIYFGNRAYGVAAAAQVYYGKTLAQLNLAEMATIAGLPQAPSRDNPIVNPGAARERRNHVLQRMLDSEHISQPEYATAIATSVETNYHESPIEVAAPYMAEMARNLVVAQYGDKSYEAGFKVYTTLDSRLQLAANRALTDGILSYDQRHGYRGREGKLAAAAKAHWPHKLKNITAINGLQPAAVLAAPEKGLRVILATGETVNLTRESLAWAHHSWSPGDLIRVYRDSRGQWCLGQIPKIEGALIALNPQDGAIMAINGGFSYAASNFNRVTQAERQTGSVFKPFVYSAALHHGFTLASIINDAPVVWFDRATKSLWRPQNATKMFYGPTTLKAALIYSRNLVSIRLLQAVGIREVVEYLQRFGFKGWKEAPAIPALALGAGSTTPLKVAEGYAVFANGGYRVAAYGVQKITLSDGPSERIIFQARPATVPTTNPSSSSLPKATRVITPQNAYLITDALHGVIEYGTGRQAKSLGRDDLAGKTGSTNDLVDGWFAGYNHQLVATVWVGFDQPRSTHEHGSRSALPIWISFMRAALAGEPSHQVPRPEEIVSVRIDPVTGLLASPEQQDAVFEIFDRDHSPTTTGNPTSSVENSDLRELKVEQEEGVEEALF